MTTRWLNKEEQNIWRSYLAATAHVAQVIDSDLRQHGLDSAEYNILVALSEAPDQQMRMSELAEEVVHSRSRLTHTVTRLEKQGLVSRQACPDDRRGILAQLTAAGFAKLDAVAPHHVNTVRATLVDAMTPDEFRALGRAMAKVQSVADWQGGTSTGSTPRRAV